MDRLGGAEIWEEGEEERSNERCHYSGQCGNLRVCGGIRDAGGQEKGRPPTCALNDMHGHGRAVAGALRE